MNANRIHYRSSFIVTKSGFAGSETVFQLVVNQIGAWLKSHFTGTPEHQYIFKPWLFRGGKVIAKTSQVAEVRVYEYDEEKRYPRFWILKFEHRDNLYHERKWRVDIALECVSDYKLNITITVSWSLSLDFVGLEPSLPSVSIPKIVTYLFNNENLTSKLAGERLTHDAKKIVIGEGRSVYQKIVNPERNAPIILQNIRNLPDVINPNGLQKLVLGSAIVYWYDSQDVHKELQHEWGKEADLFQCSTDSIRIYQNQFDKSKVYESKRHRYFNLESYQLNSWNLLNIVVQSILRITSIQFTRSIVHNFESLDEFIQNQRLAQLKSALVNETRSAVEQEYIVALEEENQLLNKQIQQLRIEADKAIEYQIQYEELLEQLDKSNRQFELVGRAQAHFADVSRSLDDLRTIWKKYPTTLSEVLRLVGTLNRDKVYILDEAMDSAEVSEFDDLEEAWKLLMALSTQLHAILFDSSESLNPEKVFKDATNFDISFKDGKMLKNDAALMSIRKRKYDGKEIDIIPHAKLDSKGKHLRVHFHVDPEKKLIVFGHCGDHLKTPGTKRRKD